MTAQSPEHMVGMVTGRVADGIIGEITLAIRGGSECFMALPYDKEESFNIGAQVLVMDYIPPRTVLVTHWTP